MKTIISLTFITVVFFLTTFCGKPPITEQPQILTEAYVDSVEVFYVLNKAKLRVHGRLPNPAYEFRYSVVEKHKNQIGITPLAKFDENATVPQVEEPFCDIVSPKLTNGKEYEVRLHGINGTKTRTIRVRFNNIAFSL